MVKNNESDYQIVISHIVVEGQTVETYGIRGKNVLFPDVSTDKSMVEDMIRRINLEKLEESQFYYFISDEIDR